MSNKRLVLRLVIDSGLDPLRAIDTLVRVHDRKSWHNLIVMMDEGGFGLRSSKLFYLKAYAVQGDLRDPGLFSSADFRRPGRIVRGVESYFGDWAADILMDKAHRIRHGSSLEAWSIRRYRKSVGI